MDLSVVMATYNRAASLREALESFSSLAYPADLTWELLVVDNNSNDGTRQVVDSFSAKSRFPVRYLFEARQGRSAALNAGIAQATGEIIAFTDDDVLLDRDWLINLKKTFDEHGCAAFAGRVVPQWKHAKPDWLEMDGHFAVTNFDLGNEVKEVKVPPLGANSAFRKDIFEKYGLFRLDLGVRGSEHTITCDDTEFGERLIKGGEKIVYNPAAIIYHPVDPKRTTKRFFLSWYYYNGVSLTRTFGVPQEGIFWFGVPRWLYREFLTNCARWLLTFDARRRFRNRLFAYRSFGNIVESHRLSRVRASVSASDAALGS
jgi:glucosyl-dolichyl phosphate glucuronosyltransferase